MEREEEELRLLALLLRVQLQGQARTILELSRLGFGPKRISELLGTSPNTVNVTIQKAKKKPAAVTTD